MFGFDIMKYILFCLSGFLQVQISIAVCNGAGFPTEWTIASVSNWFVSPNVMRTYDSSYVMTEYYEDTGILYGTPPTCESEHYDTSTGHYYYVLLYSYTSIYGPPNSKVCFSWKQSGSVLREYSVIKNGQAVASSCVSEFVSSTESKAITKDNSIYVDCPFENGAFNFTFTEDSTEDYCAGAVSTAEISGETITLDSCYDPNLVTTAKPFYGTLGCLGNWSAESRDSSGSGDFIVVEMYNSTLPYCGRYNIGSDGIITVSFRVSVSQGQAALCDGDLNYNYFDNSEYRRMIFTPVLSVSTTTESSTESTSSVYTESTSTQSTVSTSTQSTESTFTESSVSTSTESIESTSATSVSTPVELSIWNKIQNLYWPWWILIAVSFLLLASTICCLIYACKRKRRRNSKVKSFKRNKLSQSKLRLSVPKRSPVAPVEVPEKIRNGLDF